MTSDARDQAAAFFAHLWKQGGDTGRPMRWEFYFADHDPQRLSSVCQQLSSLGYTNLEILGPSPDNDDKSLVFLQFAIVEALTPASLASRCSELEAIASRLGIESFDGYDISHPDGRP